jgi:lipoate-protein ligase A
MHLWIRSALKWIGVESELATCCREELPGQCFAGYEKFDVLSNGRKIAGAAQRRNKHGLLIQGSIQPVPAGIDFQAFVTAMSESGNDPFASRSLDFDATLLKSNAQELVDSKYGTTDHNQRR